MSDFLSTVPIGELSYPAILAVVIIAIIRGDIVPRKTFDAKVKECEDWKRIALNALAVNDKAIDAAEATTAVVKALPVVPLVEDGDPV